MAADRALILGPLVAMLVSSGCVTNLAEKGVTEREVAEGSTEIGRGDNLRLGAPPPGFADYTIGLAKPDEENGMTKIRSTAITEAALSYGSQAGFNRRAWEIEKLLEKRSKQLSEVYDFERVVMGAPKRTGFVIPPVVSRSFDAFVADENGEQVSAADEYLTIVSPGRISPTIPTWRDYLLFLSPKPERPPKALLPQDKSEVAFFNRMFRKGWAAGYGQADATLDEKLARLRRDYEGMLQYRRMVARGMINRMVIADADFGVTGSNGEMRIGDRTVRIVSQAEFNTNPQTWRFAPVTAKEKNIVEHGEILKATDSSEEPTTLVPAIGKRVEADVGRPMARKRKLQQPHPGSNR